MKLKDTDIHFVERVVSAYVGYLRVERAALCLSLLAVVVDFVFLSPCRSRGQGVATAAQPQTQTQTRDKLRQTHKPRAWAKRCVKKIAYYKLRLAKKYNKVPQEKLKTDYATE